MSWTPEDLIDLHARGINPDDAWTWVERARRGPPRLPLERPCTVGDGIRRLDPSRFAELEARADAATARASAFVPASGAATRMGVDGPKALVHFHLVDGVWRTAFEEHCHEARALLGDDAHVHFTIPAGAEADFRALDVPADVSFSVQDPSTDLPALDADGQPMHVDGHLLLRPGGHGALIGNLAATGGDLVLVRNIDNTVHPDHRDSILRWRKRLLGLLLGLEEEAGRDRPLRVCGMVKNTGEPGGGPFWVDGAPQIVEGVQIDDDQRHLLSEASHFNPVDIVCSLRDADGNAHDLKQFVDPSAFIVTDKTHRGQPITAIERPGLWNGAMAGWETVFVEIPADCFHPVKRPEDLSRPAHQPAT